MILSRNGDRLDEIECYLDLVSVKIDIGMEQKEVEREITKVICQWMQWGHIERVRLR